MAQSGGLDIGDLTCGEIERREEIVRVVTR
jgi:hypothetical protein